MASRKRRLRDVPATPSSIVPPLFHPLSLPPPITPLGGGTPRPAGMPGWNSTHSQKASLMNTIPIQPFKGEHPRKVQGEPESWQPCEVVGILTPDGPAAYGKFAIVIEDEDGLLYVDAVDVVRRAV